MAINVTFNGATIYKPGAYSQEQIDLGGGFPIGPTGIVAIFGESTTGTPGSKIPDISTNVFSPDEFPAIQAEYGSGPIVDACNFLFAPGADGALPGGAQQVYIYKTNEATQAELILAPGAFTFTVISANATVGAVYSASNGYLFTVLSTIVAATTLTASGTELPPPSGVLTLVSGTGDADITYTTFTDLSYGTLESLAYGVGGNLISYTDMTVPAVPAQTSSTASFNLTGAPFTDTSSDIPQLNTPAARAAQATALAEYNTILGMPAGTTIVSGILTGTYTPGTYTASSSASLTGTITLNGAGNYYFQIGSTLTTAASATILLTGGATASNVFWQVGSSATLGATNTFNGNIIAEDSITVGGGTVNGSLIALTGAVTISVATTITGEFGTFAVLGATTVTNTGLTVVNGGVGVSPGTSVTGFPPGVITGGSDLTLVLRIDGAATSLDNTLTIPTPVITTAAFQAALNTAGNWSLGLPVGMTFTVSGTNPAAFLTVTQGLAMNAYANGYGQDFELVSGGLLTAVNILPGLYVSETEDMTVFSINNTGTLTTESDTVGGTVVLEIGRIGTGGTGAGNVAPTVTILEVGANNAPTLRLINNSMIEYTITLSNYTSLSTLVQYINGNTGGNWVAAVASNLVGALPTSALDEVTGVGANGSTGILPARIKDDAYQVQQFFTSSANVQLVQTPGQGIVGLPAPQGPLFLAGGLLGGTLSADIANAVLAIQAVHINSMVPLFSRDASADILDLITDPSSNYTIDAIHQAVKTFLSLQATTKAKNECQGYLSLKDTYLNCKLEAANMADARIQLDIQDILQVNSLGVTQWFLPWAGSCMLAGARGGAPVGLPMTFKYFNMSGIRQTPQPLSTPAAQIVVDFNPATQYDDAIQNGITFWEKPTTGGFRLVVDNTTYGADANWVYNRANVLYAADVLAYDFRNQLENIYVGVKNTVTAATVASTASTILTGYLAQGITVSTSDAANGFKQLVVQIVGNTINISVVVKLVEGIDFILATITLQRAGSTG